MVRICGILLLGFLLVVSCAYRLRCVLFYDLVQL